MPKVAGGCCYYICMLLLLLRNSIFIPCYCGTFWQVDGGFGRLWRVLLAIYII